MSDRMEEIKNLLLTTVIGQLAVIINQEVEISRLMKAARTQDDRASLILERADAIAVISKTLSMACHSCAMIDAELATKHLRDLMSRYGDEPAQKAIFESSIRFIADIIAEGATENQEDSDGDEDSPKEELRKAWDGGES